MTQSTIGDGLFQTVALHMTFHHIISTSLDYDLKDTVGTGQSKEIQFLIFHGFGSSREFESEATTDRFCSPIQDTNCNAVILGVKQTFKL